MKVATLLVLVGCASEHASGPPSPVVQPNACAQSVTLVGGTTSAPTPVGPLQLDTSGANLCVRLDATQLSRAHFMASTDQRAGTTSGFDATLQHTDYTTIVDGWDVSVGETQTQTFLNVEWSPPAGQTTDVVVWVRAAEAPAPATIQLDLFDPLE